MKNLIVANWKMNPKSETKALQIVKKIKKELIPIVGIDLVISPPAVYLPKLYGEVRLTSIKLGVQNADFRDSGPYTGEISMPMVKKFIKYIIIGHSERREHFKESDESVRKKLATALDHRLCPILCIGEKVRQVRMGDDDSFVEELRKDIKNIGPKEIEKVVIAYEPVWAIGHEKGADSSYANQMISLIRQYVASVYNREIATKVKILYGGSVDAGDVNEYLEQPEINGVLVGHNSVNAPQFVAICKRAMGK